MYCIYKLTDGNNNYYGSTNNYKRRMEEHKRRYIYCSKVGRQNEETAFIFKGNFTPTILEKNIPSKNIAIIREGYYISNFPCVNKQNPDTFFCGKKRKIKKKVIYCGCGAIYEKNNKSRHHNTIQHQTWLTNQSITKWFGAF